LLDHGLPSAGDTSAKLASRRSRGSIPVSSASSFIALSNAQSPGPSTGARIGVGTLSETRSISSRSRIAGDA
jgi:hypothetical protein